MGFFSWRTSDTNRSISNKYSIRGTFPVYLLIPKEFQNEYGKYIEEKDYEGYGVFGNKDVFSLIAKWNFPEKCYKDGKLLDDDTIRMIGIENSITYEDNKNLKYPLKIVENKDLSYEEAKPSIYAQDQGFFYSLSKEETINMDNLSSYREGIADSLKKVIKGTILDLLESRYENILNSEKFTTEKLENLSISLSEDDELNDYIDGRICEELDIFKHYYNIKDSELEEEQEV